MIRLLTRTLLVVVVIGLAVGTWVYVDYQRAIRQPLLSAGSEPQLLDVPRGSSLRGVIAELERRGLTDQGVWLRLWGRLNQERARIQAGEYRIEPGQTAPELFARMAAGEVVLYSFTIVEGWTFRQLMNALQEHPALELTLAGRSVEEIVETLGLDWPHPEGLFYPDTYRFPRGTTDVQFLRRAHHALRQRLLAEWEQRAEGLPLKDPYEALILASIIERETGVDAERGKVAGVFVRRLQRGMRLQTDPTVIYGVGPDFEGRLRTRHLRTDTPYNTYTRHGLPPTPIAMPSGASIRAALNPAEGRELYFVSRGDGSHHFSETLEEHNRAVRKYILGLPE